MTDTFEKCTAEMITLLDGIEKRTGPLPDDALKDCIVDAAKDYRNAAINLVEPDEYARRLFALKYLLGEYQRRQREAAKAKQAGDN